MITPSHAPPTRHATSTFSPPPSSSSTFGREQSEWDEAFLDFLWAAVSKLPAVRRILLTVPATVSDTVTEDVTGIGRVPDSVASAVTGTVAVTDNVTHPTRLGVTSKSPRARVGAGLEMGVGSGVEIGVARVDAVGQGVGVGATASVTSAPAAAAAVATVLRRLYHPRPSVRRIASLIAVRLAFDAAAFFFPLLPRCHRFRLEELGGGVALGGRYCTRCCQEGGVGGGGGGGGGGGRCREHGLVLREGGGGIGGGAGVGVGDGGVDSGVGSRGGGNDVSCGGVGVGGVGSGGGRGGGGGKDCGAEFIDDDGPVLPPMVVRAYPRLKEWTGGGGGGSGRCSGCCGCSSCSSCSGSGISSETPLFVKLAAGEWALLTRKKVPLGLSRDIAGRRGEGEGGTEGGRAERGVVMARFERALQGAGRRSEFAAAMLEARAWMLSGHG